MNQLKNHQYFKGKAIKIFFALSFVGLIIGGYTISADKDSVLNKVGVMDEVTGLLQKNNVYVPSKKVIENNQKGSSVTGSRG